MAIRVTFQLMDDLDGTVSPDVERITFGLDGMTYEIDLKASHATRLRADLAPFVDVARRTGHTHSALQRLLAQRFGEATLPPATAKPTKLAAQDWPAEERRSA